MCKVFGENGNVGALVHTTHYIHTFIFIYIFFLSTIASTTGFVEVILKFSYENCVCPCLWIRMCLRIVGMYLRLCKRFDERVFVSETDVCVHVSYPGTVFVSVIF